jgi:hypothetical protein
MSMRRMLARLPLASWPLACVPPTRCQQREAGSRDEAARTQPARTGGLEGQSGLLFPRLGSGLHGRRAGDGAAQQLPRVGLSAAPGPERRR